jgi:ABC-type amino acid transport substrate-binding protein
MIALFTVLFLVVLALTLYKYFHQVFRMGVGPWGNRTLNWITRLGSSNLQASGANFSDFVGLGGFSLSILAIVLGYFSIVLQAKKATLEQETRDLNAKIAEKQKHIETNLKDLEVKPAELIKLGAPKRDAQLIGNHVDLSWSYSDHSPFLTYLVEVRNKEESQAKLQSGFGLRCKLDQYRSCTYIATDPAGQHTQIFASNTADLSGQYLWRVVPARRAVNISDDEADRIADWSQFRAFSIYPTIRDRISKTHNVIVGTTYAEDARFSSLGPEGHPQGHDIDLIKILIEQCLALGSNDALPRYDPEGCEAAANDYGAHPYKTPSHVKGLKVDVKAFSSISDGLNALSRREVDAFIGSLTRARNRERGPILFTQGYYRFNTQLYAKAEEGQHELVQWLVKKRTIGCINNSSNYWLATFLAAEDALRNQVTVMTFDTFPEMESAFDRGEVDGVLLDDVLHEQLVDAIPLEGLQKTDAWTKYHDDPNALGFPKEEFSIAVVMDVGGDQVETNPSWVQRIFQGFRRMSARFIGLFTKTMERKQREPSLFQALQFALQTSTVQENLLPKLRNYYKIPNAEVNSMPAFDADQSLPYP